MRRILLALLDVHFSATLHAQTNMDSNDVIVVETEKPKLLTYKKPEIVIPITRYDVNTNVSFPINRNEERLKKNQNKLRSRYHGRKQLIN